MMVYGDCAVTCWEEALQHQTCKDSELIFGISSSSPAASMRACLSAAEVLRHPFSLRSKGLFEHQDVVTAVVASSAYVEHIA